MRLYFIIHHLHILSCVLHRGVQLTGMILLDSTIGLQLTVHTMPHTNVISNSPEFINDHLTRDLRAVQMQTRLACIFYYV